GLAARASLYLAGNVLDPAGLEEEGRLRRAAGLPAVFLPRRAVRERFGVTAPAGLLSFANLTADPVRLARAYLRVAIGRGARVFAPVEASAVETGRDGVVVATAGGPTIAAETVVFCTGYELPE
ncbi:MAG TPA: FAD-dependent oxidoreductase, partial [Bauldia sp.]|nr:FAD-dependent oxidoreductase [Bauldia sp.]